MPTLFEMANAMLANQSEDQLSIDDRFIPVRAEDLTRVLAEDTATFGDIARALSDIAEAVTYVIDQEVVAFERDLAHSYSRFNPDRDTVLLPTDAATDDAAELERVMSMLTNLLWQANFEEMDERQVVAAIQAANSHGLRIRLDPERVTVLRVWARGHGTTVRMKRPWRRPWRKEPVEVEVLKRLAVAVQMRDHRHVMLKLFKDIPIADLEALLPHARVRMGPKELATLVGSGGGAVWALATKIITTGLAAAGQLLYVVAVPLAGLGWRTFSGYRRALRDRDSERTKHLYFQNLANNASAIHMLATVVEQEEIKEALLVYAFCASHQFAEGGTTLKGRLDSTIEGYLHDKFGVSVNFDMPDAVETMDRLGLWEDRDRYRVVRPDEALEILERHRIERRSASYHGDLVARAQAVLQDSGDALQPAN